MLVVMWSYPSMCHHCCIFRSLGMSHFRTLWGDAVASADAFPPGQLDWEYFKGILWWQTKRGSTARTLTLSSRRREASPRWRARLKLMVQSTEKGGVKQLCVIMAEPPNWETPVSRNDQKKWLRPYDQKKHSFGFLGIYTCVYFFWARRCLRSCVRLPPVCSSDRHLATNSAALAGTCPSQLHLQWCLQPPCWNMGRHAAILQPVKCQRIPMAFDFYAFLHVSG